MKTLLESDLDIKKAHDIYKNFTQDKELRYAYEAREKWKKDYASSMASAHRKGMKEGELLNQQHILIKLLSRKFGLTEAEKELICSTDNLEKLEKAIEETVFKDSKSQLLNYLK